MGEPRPKLDRMLRRVSWPKDIVGDDVEVREARLSKRSTRLLPASTTKRASEVGSMATPVGRFKMEVPSSRSAERIPFVCVGRHEKRNRASTMNLLKASTPHAEEKEICVFFSMMACVACYSVPWTLSRLLTNCMRIRAVLLSGTLIIFIFAAV